MKIHINEANQLMDRLSNKKEELQEFTDNI